MAIQAFNPNKRSLSQVQDDDLQQRSNFGSDQITAATLQYLDREISLDQFAESIDNLGDFVDLLDDSN